MRLLPTLLAVGLLMASSSAFAQVAKGALEVQWNEGAADCKARPQPPLEVHAYSTETFILRENLCATFEAPFMYLLIGSKKALLIDTGDVADPKLMPLAETIVDLLPGTEPSKMPLLVVHTHRHGDHRAGDGQFANLPNVQVVGWDLDSVRRYYHFTDWPNGLAHIESATEQSTSYRLRDTMRRTLCFTTEIRLSCCQVIFLCPGAFSSTTTRPRPASAKRVAAFVKDRPVSYVLGGHIEFDEAGNLFPWGSQYHPHEHRLQMTKDDVLALPAVVSSFNGFYTRNGAFVLMNSVHNLIALAVVAGIALTALILGLILYIRRRRRARTLSQSGQLA